MNGVIVNKKSACLYCFYRDSNRSYVMECDVLDYSGIIIMFVVAIIRNALGT